MRWFVAEYEMTFIDPDRAAKRGDLLRAPIVAVDVALARYG